MKMTTILTKRFSIEEILKSVAVVTLAPLTMYILYVQNLKLSVLSTYVTKVEESSKKTEKKLKVLSEEVTQLKKINAEQKAFVEEMQSGFKNTTDTITPDPNLVAVQNEMTQFYIKTAVYVVAAVAVVVVVCVVSSSSKSWFSIENILPESTFKFIQRNTPFLQDRQEFPHHDIPTGTSWKVDIINKETVDLKVKPKDGHDYTTVSDWINGLRSEWQTTQVQSPDTRQVLETTLSSLPTDISSAPLGSEIDIIVTNTNIDTQAAAAAAEIADHISRLF